MFYCCCKDRHILPHDRVEIDSKQDWQLLGFKQSDAFTIFKFKRPVGLDNSEDRSIMVIRCVLELMVIKYPLIINIEFFLKKGSNYLIFAWVDMAPQPGFDIENHHANRGSIQVTFFD